MKSLVFTYVLTYGGAVASLVRPYVGFLIYTCFAILKPDSLWFWSVPAGNYSRIVALALLLGWALNGFGDWRLGRGGRIVRSMIAYWLVLVAGAVTASNAELGWQSVEPMAKVFLPLLAAATLIDSVAKLRQLAWVIVLSQGYLAYEFNLTYYTTEVFIPWEFFHAGLDNNGIAITMVTAIGLAFYLGLHAERWWQKAAAFGSAALMAHVVLFSNSRGGMLSLLITMAACFVLTPKRPRDYLYLLLGVAIVVRLAGAGVQERFMTIVSEKGEVEGADQGGKRLEHWKGCIDTLLKRPLGVGPNHWPITAPEYGLPVMAAHSTWLQMAAELGWPGVICLWGIYGTCLVRLWPLTRARTPVPDPWVRYLARMVIAGLIGFLASAQFVTVDGVELPYYLALIGAGTLRVASRPVPEWGDPHADDAPAGAEPATPQPAY
jgi:putative inorganic carbon (hco3(-)) transporter